MRKQRNPRLKVEIKINLAWCLFGVAAILKVLI